MHRDIARRNGERIVANPSLALDAITRQQSTFKRGDMAIFAHRHSDGIDQFNKVMDAMRSAPYVIEIGRDGRGEERFTTRDMIEAEQRLHRAAECMAELERHKVNDAKSRSGAGACEGTRPRAFWRAGRCAGAYHARARSGGRRRLRRNGQERDARGSRVRPGRWQAIRSGGGALRHRHRKSRKRIRLSRRAPSPAWNMVGDSAAICSPRVMSWSSTRPAWSARASWSGVLFYAAEAGAKVVLVGDPQQLQAIEAGAAFRSLYERHGGAEIGAVRRQREDWQRNASTRSGDSWPHRRTPSMPMTFIAWFMPPRPGSTHATI